MRLLTHFILILITTLTLIGQVNTEKYRTPEELRGIAGFFEVSGTIKTGNSEKTEAGIDGRLDWRTENSLTFLVFQNDYEWVDGERFSNEGLLHARYVRKIFERFRVEAFGQINYDKKIRINDRELIGAGIRYTILDLENSDVTLGTAYMFEHENYDLPNSAMHVAEADVHRWSNYLTYHLKINDFVEFGGVFYYQPMFAEFSDYRLLYESNLAVKLTDLLSLSVNFKLRHDSIPADNIDNTDTTTDFGIAIKF